MATQEYFRASANNMLRAIESRRKEISDINAEITVLRSKVTDEKNSIQREKAVRMSDLKAGQTERKITEKRLTKEIDDLNRQLQDSRQKTPDQGGNPQDQIKGIESLIQEKQVFLDNFLRENAGHAANNVRELQDEQNDLKKLEKNMNDQIAQKQNQIRAIEQDIVETEQLMQALQRKAG